MATWKSENVLLTLKGNEALSKVLAGQGKLTVTRIVTGAGYVSPSTLYNQKNVSDIKQTLEISRVVTDANGSEISTTLSNINLDTAYSLYQIGVYCRHTDSDEEFLYLIAQCETDKPDTIPANTDTIANFSYNLYIQHEGTTQFEVAVNQSGVLYVSMLDKPNGVAGLDSGGLLPKEVIPNASKIYLSDGVTSVEEAMKNWDKIEATVLLSLAAAAPYSAEQTYNLGAYCTREGKLYKCTTAITGAEAWTAEHWTETTVMNELVSLFERLNTSININAMKIQRLENAMYEDITGNPHSITFDSLDGLTVTGVWNEASARLEC